ncbi:hypothetical protein CEY12_20745 [Chryseobacterium sp. T16E-39]|uniref:DUF3945 domain-containing protein n=1 Tax=Chryseobacterium sp. T16E-39 TaxID=2015076 RepID=UPI000B5B13FD|nr:DUF3945 domain-containing protein [Chryseobacterium sp. T16E-39]ASK32363.1 hypothetical protein CEY12_20745 [Chryseobacterium sp. T16E-39]
MQRENNINESVEKIRDTLLVLNNTINTIGLVQGVDKEGNIKEVLPEGENSGYAIRIDTDQDSFTSFFTDFYSQLKNPSEFSFFKVTEYEAVETAKELQEFVNQASGEEILGLKQYEVSIDRVEAYKNQTLIGSDKDNSLYRYEVGHIDWDTMGKLGLNREKLEKMNALESLLRGFKTPMLIPVTINLGTAVSTMEVRLSLYVQDSGGVGVRLHRVRKEPDLTSKFFGHEFTREDKRNLLESGNMGRVVDLINPRTDEVIPSVVSKDRLTNELIALRAEFIRVPLVIKGVTLDMEQRRTLLEGKALFIENMLSKRVTLFNAIVQFNADKRYVEFLFKKNIKSLRLRDLDGNGKAEVPGVFRGKKLYSWQMDKLNAGETAYISGLVDKGGKKYQGYLRFDKGVGKFEFSFKNPGKEVSNAQKKSNISRGKKL